MIIRKVTSTDRGEDKKENMITISVLWISGAKILNIFQKINIKIKDPQHQSATTMKPQERSTGLKLYYYCGNVVTLVLRSDLRKIVKSPDQLCIYRM